jgi:protease-4
MTQDSETRESPESAAPKPERGASSPGWEREVLERVALEGIREQRLSRRWGIFFKLFFVFYLMLLLILAQSDDLPEKPVAGEFTALVALEGTIEPDGPTNADNMVSSLRDAFESKAKAVIVRANSGGGATVQSAYISDELRRLRKEHKDKPVYGVISDVCASGCYYILSGADKIYANEASLVGSIGVILDGGFGLVEAIRKLGIERRLYTAGEYKGSLDPFLPVSETDKRHVKNILGEVHEQFKQVVRSGRGDRLKETPDMFSGRFWTGRAARDMGLVDEFGSASYVARDVIGAEHLVDFTYRPSWLDRFTRGLGSAIGSAIAVRLGEGAIRGVR